MSSESFSDNNCGNQHPFLKLGDQLSENEGQRNSREVPQPESNDSPQVVEEYFDESYGDNLQTYRTDTLLTEVTDIETNMTDSTEQPVSSSPPPAPLPSAAVGEVDSRAESAPQATPQFPLDRYFRSNPISHPIYPPYSILPPPVFVEPPQSRSRKSSTRPATQVSSFYPVQCTVEELKGTWNSPSTAGADKDLSNEGASGSSKDEIEKNKNDEKEQACSKPQTSKYNLGDPSSEDIQSEADSSSQLDERAGSLELGTIMEETEAAEQDTEVWKIDSQQTGLRKRTTAQINKDSPHEKRDAQTMEAEETESNTAKPLVSDTAENPELQEVKTEGAQGETPLEMFDTYRFEDFNPMSGLDDPFDEGMRNLCAGNVSYAALCLEAAICSTPPIPFPDSAAAWLCLGISQAANEQDTLAIIALKKYLKYEPDNLHALIFLTVSYINEKYTNLAIITLWEWLSKNPKYSDMVKISPPEDMYDVSSPINLDFHQQLLNEYLKAANIYPRGNIDADVQCALGLLYNMTNEYAKASDCFKTAALVDPCDEMLWNHLGEALTNNYRCNESLEAYQNALNLRPKYARARYNLGVSCGRLGDHKVAMQHYLRALFIQAKSSRGLVGRMTDTIWETVKETLRLMDRPDLEDAVERRDLVALNKAFEIE